MTGTEREKTAEAGERWGRKDDVEVDDLAFVTDTPRREASGWLFVSGLGDAITMFLASDVVRIKH